jgi:hypothetical protein
MDINGSGRVKMEEVQLAFAFVGVQISGAECDALEKRFGTTQARVLDARALLDHSQHAGSCADGSA